MYLFRVQGKKVTCKKAEARQGKIYVGKLPTEGVSVEDIQNYFAQVSYFRKLIFLLSLQTLNILSRCFCLVWSSG